MIKNLEIKQKGKIVGDSYQQHSPLKISEVHRKPQNKKSLRFGLNKDMKYYLYSLVLILLVSVFTYLSISVGKGEISLADSAKTVAGESIKVANNVLNEDASQKRFYSVLIMGIDTRGVEFDGEKYVATHPQGTRKIDVIMQMVYDRQNNRINLISIPRDTSIVVEEECMHQEREDQKYINRIYDMAEKNNCPQSGPEMMKKYVSYITGYEVDHYSIITLEKFVELIDIVGVEHNGKTGIWLDVPRNISDYCPNDYFGYDYVYYEQGRQFMNSREALCYVRVRKTSSDFDRNRRQQELIDEILNLVIKDDNLTDPVKVFQIYQKLSKDTQMSKISLADLSLGFELLQEADLSNINKIVLDDHFGGVNAYLTKPLYSKPGTHDRVGGFYLIPIVWDHNCCRDDEWKLVRNYLHKLVDDPAAKPDQASIFAYVNSYTSGKAIFDNPDYRQLKTSAEQNNLYFTESKYALAMDSNGPDIQIVDYSNGEKRHIAEKLSSYIPGSKVYDASDANFQHLNNEEIAILVRPNY